MKTIHPMSLAIFAAVLSLPACATKGDLRNVTTELRAVAAKQDSIVVALQRQALITQDSLRGATSQLMEVRGTVNQQVARLLQEVQMLRQENAQFAQLLAGIRDQLERVSRTASAPPPAAPDAPGREPGPGNSAAVDRFQSAMEQFTLRNFSTARRGFQAVIDQYPNETELASESKYKLGEILLIEEKPEEALVAFQQIGQLYPDARRVPEALLQVAQIHLDRGRREDARRTFTRIIETYPNTSVAATAQDRLRSIPPG
jgi:tol-pal system protein YbgF